MGGWPGKPACTLLHLGPGYANGAANLHNARRAYTPIVNVIGDHATDHRQYDAPLNSDIAALAAPNSIWVKSADSADARWAPGRRGRGRQLRRAGRQRLPDPAGRQRLERDQRRRAGDRAAAPRRAPTPAAVSPSPRPGRRPPSR
jgi:hypothetical protein